MHYHARYALAVDELMATAFGADTLLSVPLPPQVGAPRPPRPRALRPRAPRRARTPAPRAQVLESGWDVHSAWGGAGSPSGRARQSAETRGVRAGAPADGSRSA